MDFGLFRVTFYKGLHNEVFGLVGQVFCFEFYHFLDEVTFGYFLTHYFPFVFLSFEQYHAQHCINSSFDCHGRVRQLFDDCQLLFSNGRH